MRMILAAAALAAAMGAASVASATTFTGNYTVTGYWDSNNGGLNLDIDDRRATSASPASTSASPRTFTLFEINADEAVNVPDPNGSPNDDDATARPINVNFTFSAPQNLPGGGPDGIISGVTVGVQGGQDDYGQVTWNGPATVNFGNYGLLTISLSNATFDTGDYESGKVKATFKLSAPLAGGAVPEPATWGMMIMGFGMAGATLRRRRTAVAAA